LIGTFAVQTNFVGAFGFHQLSAEKRDRGFAALAGMKRRTLNGSCNGGNSVTGPD